jgi:hypothetical protein
MLVRATLSSLPIIATLVLCGCSPQSTYNIPEDPSKEVAEIAKANPQKTLAVGRKKVTKPPGGGSLKDSKGMQPLD